MKTKDVYMSNLLKYPLTEDEYNKLDEVWEFIESFNIGHITISEYRKKIIDRIKRRYNIKNFYDLEMISEKIFWNLKSALEHKFDFEENIKKYNFDEFDKIIENLKNDNYYRSFINKIVNINFEENKIYYRPMEGSCGIFKKSLIGEVLSNLFFNKTKYEIFMQNKLLDDDLLKTNKIYYQLDFGFPNLNLCEPFLYKNKNRFERINYMYFDNNCEVNWIKIFYFNI